MRVEQMTGPSGVALHAISSRYGGRLDLWLDPDGNLSLFVYNTVGVDLPAMVLAPDEAEEFIDILHRLRSPAEHA